MKFLSLLLIIFITGCSLIKPIPKRKFPDAPEELLVSVEPFSTIPEDTKELDVLITNASENYARCYELKQRHESLVKWYKEQKNIFNSVK